jgi:ATP-binding cassette subfamily C protein LapB
MASSKKEAGENFLRTIGNQILESFSPLKAELKWIVISSVVINVLALTTPLVMLQIFDRILAKGSMETLTLIMGGALIAVAVESLVKILRSHLSAWIAARFEHKAMINVTSRMLEMPLHEFEKTGPGAHNDHFKAIQSLKSFYSGQTFQHMMDIPFTLFYILVMIFISPWVGLLVLLGYVAFSWLIWREGFKHTKLVEEKSQGDLRRTNFLVETLTNIHTLKSMTMEALMLRRYERLQENSAKSMQRLSYALDVAQHIGGVFSPLMSLLVIALGAYLVITNRLTTGELAACILLSGRSLAPIQRLGLIWARHQQEAVMSEDLAKLMVLPELTPESSFADHKKATGAIELHNVSYQFPGTDKPIFKNMSVNIKGGECIFIHSANGTGRTTLLHLLGGLINPTSGKVIVDQRDLLELGPEFAKKSIAYLPQRTQLFEGSLIDNISVFDRKRMDEALDKADALKINGFVSKLPRGWDSPVGDAAADSMTPGFRQRIAIVRALANNPSIILFDDATAAVDNEGEKFVLEYLQSVKGKKTIILVTQRPSIQKLADRVVTLVDGQLLEGLHEIPDHKVSKTPVTPALSLVQSNQTAEHAAESPANVWERTNKAVQSTFRQNNDLAGCFPLLLQAMGWRRSSRDVVEALPYFTDSLDLTGYENGMAQLGFKCHQSECLLGDIDARLAPCLFIPENGNAFVLLERHNGTFLVSSSMSDEPHTIEKNNIAGTAYFFLEKGAVKQNTPVTSWVKTAILRFRPLIIQAGISSVLSGLIMVIGSLFMMVVYNEIIPSGSIKILLYLAFGVLLSLAVSMGLVYHRANILSYIAGRIEYLFGTTILQQIMRLSPAMSERSAVGAQIARLSAFEAIRDLFTGPLASTILESPATLVVLIALGIINPPALIVFVVVIAIYALLYWTLEPKTSKLVAEYGAASTKRNEFIVEMITKMRTVRESGGVHTWLERFRNVSAEATMASFWTERLSSTLVGVSYFVMMSAGLMIITITIPLTLTNVLGPGALIASMFLMWRILGPIQTIFTNLARIERLRSATRQLDNLMQIKGERIDAASSPISRGLKGNIQFSRVSFRYSLNVDPALIGVDFSASAGEIIAITGSNGGGKSTLLKLMMGMYQPQAGSILIDGVDIRQLDPIELRQLIGYAPQETQFFRATIAQNLRLSRPDATDGEVREALEMAGAMESVNMLPKGIEYRIGDNASEQLPASLRQTLNLARAYLTKAPIMLFDEPGASLDSREDACFIEALKKLRGHTTVFFISHRPSHLKLADHIIVMDRGYIRASGTPDELFKPKTPKSA